jgi:hypothetical protein
MLFGALIGDLSGLNTTFILPEGAKIWLDVRDQYIRDQVLENGRWTRAGRSAFTIEIFVIDINNVWTHVASVTANDVAFDTSRPVEELGYVWVDLVFADNVPRVKVREDVFINSLAIYMGEEVTDDESIFIGLTTLIQAFMQDSWLAFEPDVIRVTTSNQIFKDLFGVDELIATFAVQIGFKQRVRGIDDLEFRYAMYTVGHFSDLAGPSPYEVKLHETIPVFFDFGDRLEVSHFWVTYTEQSIRVTGATYYFPSLGGVITQLGGVTNEYGQFMGVTRNYRVHITGGTDRALSAISELTEKHHNWEPLAGDFPRNQLGNYSVEAFYGTSGERAQYSGPGVVYNFYAYFDRETGYYIVPNQFGYDILFKKPTATNHGYYVVDLGTQNNLNQAYEWLTRDGYPIYPRVISDMNRNRFTYVIDENLTLHYAMDNNEVNVVYVPTFIPDEDNPFIMIPAGGYYIVGDAQYSNAIRFIPNGAEIRLISGGTRQVGNITYTLVRDLITNHYLVLHPTANNFPGMLFDGTHFWVGSIEHQQIAAGLEFGYEEKNLVFVNASLPFNRIATNIWENLDWADDTFKNVNFGRLDWDNMTLEGGLFIVEIYIGYGMMATHRELVSARVLNRTVDTDNFILSSFLDGDGNVYRALTPVLRDAIDIDPYVYALFMADYKNNLNDTTYNSFAEWYFRHYPTSIYFTQIYFNENDTLPVANREIEGYDFHPNFIWDFEVQCANNRAGICLSACICQHSTYRETQINNRNTVVTTTYVLTNFHGQYIALELRVQPRLIDTVCEDEIAGVQHICDGTCTARRLTRLQVDGEKRLSEYTIDALIEASYTIPVGATIYLRGANNEQYTINFTNFNPSVSTIFAGLPAGLVMSSNNIGASNAAQGSSIVRWTHPRANNVTLVGNTGHPFHQGEVPLIASVMPLTSDYVIVSGTARVYFANDTVATDVKAGDTLPKGTIIISGSLRVHTVDLSSPVIFDMSSPQTTGTYLVLTGHAEIELQGSMSFVLAGEVIPSGAFILPGSLATAVPIYLGEFTLNTSAMPAFSDFIIIAGWVKVFASGQITTLSAGQQISRTSIIIEAGAGAKGFVIDENSAINNGFIDLRSHVDPQGNWFKADWFNMPLINIRVLVPDKVVDRVDTVFGKDDAHNISLRGDHWPSLENGVWRINPHVRDTWVLPNEIEVWFNTDTPNVFDRHTYQIVWEPSGIIEFVDGRFRFTEAFIFAVDNSLVPIRGARYALIQTVVGDRDNPYMSLLLDIRVIRESEILEAFEGYHQGIYLVGSKTQTMPYDMDSAWAEPTPEPAWLGARYYRYEVDTFFRFDLPSVITVKFDDGSFRDFAVSGWTKVWSLYVNDFYSPGNQVLLRATLGDGYNFNVFIMVCVADRGVNAVEGIRFTGFEDYFDPATGGTNSDGRQLRRAEN